MLLLMLVVINIVLHRVDEFFHGMIWVAMSITVCLSFSML